MKKLLFLLLTAFAVTACNDDCNHGFDSNASISDILVGSWYEETLNEEDTYNANGSFYGRFCNTINQGEGNGRYFIDSNRKTVTWSYTANSSERLEDWKISDVTDLGFTLKSDMAILNYGKVVEVLNMKGGETRQIAFNQGTVLGYESKNCNIANVTSGGLVTTTGEKGVTYVKIKLEQCNVWAKVIVGEDTPDLWVDYSFLLGQGYAEMKDFLGATAQSKESITNTIFAFGTGDHNILKGTYVLIENVSHTIVQIELYIKSGVTNEEILAYMNSRYYPIGNDNSQYYFSTSPTLEDSRAVYIYSPTDKVVFTMSAEDYMKQTGLAVLPNFSALFGRNKEEVKLNMQTRRYTFRQSFDAYSLNGSDSYTIHGYDNAYAAEFIFNPDNVVSEYWIYLNHDMKGLAEILKYLRDHYTEATDEYVESYGRIFYNSNRTLKVRYDLSSFAVIFTDLTKKAVSRVILGNYWKGLGMTKNELISTFGEPYQEDDTRTVYAVVNEYISVVNFIQNTETNKVNLINIFLRDEVAKDVIIDYANSLYVYYESGTNNNGNYHKWINAATLEDADMMITYYPEYGVIVYQHPSNATPQTKSFILPDYTDMFGKTKTEVQEMIQAKGGAIGLVGSQVWYRDPKEDYINQIWFDFNTSGNWKCNQLIFWLDMESLTEDGVAEYLKSKYDIVSEWKGTKYTLKDNNKSINIIYEVALNKITLSI